MTLLEAKQALIQRAIEFRNKYPVGCITHSLDEQVARRKKGREKQHQEILANRELESDVSEEDCVGPITFFDNFVADIDKRWEEQLASSPKPNLPQAVRTLNAQGSCSLTFFRTIRQTSFGNERCPEERKNFNNAFDAFDAFDAFHPERASWTPTPKLMRTAGAVLACGLALSSAHIYFGLLFVAAVLLYFNKPNSPYFEPTVIDEAFSEDALEGMLALTPN
jgi:hypothetical protein